MDDLQEQPIFTKQGDDTIAIFWPSPHRMMYEVSPQFIEALVSQHNQQILEIKNLKEKIKKLEEEE